MYDVVRIKFQCDIHAGHKCSGRYLWLYCLLLDGSAVAVGRPHESLEPCSAGDAGPHCCSKYVCLTCIHVVVGEHWSLLSLWNVGTAILSGAERSKPRIFHGVDSRSKTKPTFKKKHLKQQLGCAKQCRDGHKQSSTAQHPHIPTPALFQLAAKQQMPHTSTGTTKWTRRPLQVSGRCWLTGKKGQRLSHLMHFGAFRTK